jgi:hypothetical protein
VGIAVREHDQVALPKSNRFVAVGLGPTGTLRHQVILDDTLRAGHHLRGNVTGRRRRRNPRRGQLEIEVDRAGQTNGAKHVREDVSTHIRTSEAGRAGIRGGRSDGLTAILDAQLRKSDACTWS